MNAHGPGKLADASPFDELLSRHFDGELSFEDGCALARVLANEPACAREFARLATLHHQSRLLLQYEQALGAPIGDDAAGGAWLDWRSTVGFFVLLLAVVALGTWHFADHQAEPGRQAPDASLTNAGPSGDASAMENASTTLDSATEGRSVSAVEIVSGTARIELPGVGSAIVDGPAELVLLDSMHARLNKGRVRVHVTEKSGYGFTVETPYGEVVDLGTEFGLEVPEEGSAGLVVFDGAVDLRVNASAEAKQPAQIRHLVQGEGLTFNQLGQFGRIDSIVTGTVATFLQSSHVAADGQSPLILSVSDNGRGYETKKFYEIVPGGFQEDVRAYVDRPHQWNGSTAAGLPAYLLGADYVRTFGQDRERKGLQIRVVLARPAELYIIADERIATPRWLQEDFELMGDKIGIDLDRWGTHREWRKGIGPGKSIDARLNIWKRTIAVPGEVVLGPPREKGADGGMYGIAAVGLSPHTSEKQHNEKQKEVETSRPSSNK